MTRREYTDQVLAALRHVTPKERADIQAEIDGHMEDHICALEDLGYPEDLAEERTMAAMGDPKEVGRELNKQYPFRWLAIKWSAIALTLMFTLMMLVPAWHFAGQVADNLWNRFYPLHQLDLWDISFVGWVDDEYVHIVADTVEVDLKRTDDGVTLWVYQVGLEAPTAEETVAWAAVSLYSENPFGRSPQLLGSLIAPDGRDVIASGFRSFGGPFMVRESVTRGENMDFTYELMGHRFTFTVPLPWEEAS